MSYVVESGEERGETADERVTSDRTDGSLGADEFKSRRNAFETYEENGGTGRSRGYVGSVSLLFYAWVITCMESLTK